KYLYTFNIHQYLQLRWRPLNFPHLLSLSLTCKTTFVLPYLCPLLSPTKHLVWVSRCPPRSLHHPRNKHPPQSSIRSQNSIPRPTSFRSHFLCYVPSWICTL